MEVLSLTVFLSLCLAAWFTLAFVRSALKPHAGAWEREALLPLTTTEERNAAAGTPAEGMAKSAHHESEPRPNPH